MILAIVLFIIAEISASTTWSAASSMAASMETVNRTHKTDRLPLVPVLHRNTLSIRLEHPAKLPVDCESVASPITRSPLRKVQGIACRRKPLSRLAAGEEDDIARTFTGWMPRDWSPPA
jgi:hypothetical protein